MFSVFANCDRVESTKQFKGETQNTLKPLIADNRDSVETLMSARRFANCSGVRRFASCAATFNFSGSECPISGNTHTQLLTAHSINSTIETKFTSTNITKTSFTHHSSTSKPL